MWRLVPRSVPELIGRLALVLPEGSRGEVRSHVSHRMTTGILRAGWLGDTNHMGARPPGTAKDPWASPAS